MYKTEPANSRNRGKLWLIAWASAKRPEAAPLLVAACANLGVMLASAVLFTFAAGASVRPMPLAAFCLGMTFLGLLASLWGLYLMISRKALLLPIMAVGLGLIPYPLFIGMIHLAIYLRGFTMSP
jgi:hypothetical protein